MSEQKEGGAIMPVHRTLTHRTAVPYIDPLCRGLLSDRFRRLLELVSVDVERGQDSALRLRVSSIDDWLFCSVEGRGKAIVGTDRQALRLSNHILLTLPISGENHSLQQPRLLPSTGLMSLSQYPDVDAIVSSGEFSYLCAYIPQHCIESITDAGVPCGRSIKTGHGSGAVVSSAFVSLAREAFQDGGNRAIAPLLPDFLRMTLNSFGARTAPPEEDSHLPSAYVRVLRYLNAHFTEISITPAAVSRSCGISIRQLYREFSRQGDSFEGRLRQLRLRHAADLLVSRPYEKIAQIAYAAGFGNPIVFSRVFRLAYGETPTDYRAGYGGTRRS